MADPDWLSRRDDVVVIEAFVQPRAAKNALAGVHGSALKIKITAPPVDDRANRALEDFLAGLIRVPRSHVKVVTGSASRHKRIEVVGVGLEEVAAALNS
jgi:uncharacterized protein